MAIRKTQDSIDNDPAMVGTHYSVRNPHPGWNAEDPENPFDPNIKNEFGHTEYPKYIDHPWKKEVLISHSSVPIGGGQTRNDVHKHEKDVKGRQFPLKVVVHSKEEEDRVLAEKEGEESKPVPKKHSAPWPKQ